MHEVAVDDDTSVILRRHGNPDGPRLALSHGNGLAIDLYYPFWSLLIDEFDLVIYDLRNHGWNRTGPLPNHNLPALSRDQDVLARAIELHYGRKPTVGVFHSVSGLASLLSPSRGSGYAGLMLFDPPLCRPDNSHERFEAAATRVAGIARSRTQRFKSLAQYIEVLELLPTFRHVVPGVPDLLARTTLREDDSGPGYALRCPREYEAQIIDYAGAFAVLVDFSAYRCPVKVVGADPTLPYSYLPSLDLTDTLEVEYDFLPDSTHFLPLEQPEECAEELRNFLKTLSLG